MWLKAFIVHILKFIKKKFCYFFFKLAALYDVGWWASEFEVLRGWQHDCSNACCKKKFLFMTEKSSTIRIGFRKYWILINLCKLKVEIRIFLQKKWSKTVRTLDNFKGIKKPLRIILDNLITKKCAKFQVHWMKIVWLMLPANLKNPVLKKKYLIIAILKKKIIKFFSTSLKICTIKAISHISF